MWEHEEAENESTAIEAEEEGLCRGAQAGVSVGSERGHSVASGDKKGDKKRGRVQKIGGVWGRNPARCGNPVDQAKSLRGSVGCQGSRE